MSKGLKESELLAAYLWDKYRTRPQWKNVRLGPLPSAEMARMYMVALRYADAIVDAEGKIIIIEASLLADPGKVGQLENYIKLFPSTPEFSQYKDWPIEAQLLSARMSLDTMELASAKGYKFIVFDINDVNRVRTEMQKPLLQE